MHNSYKPETEAEYVAARGTRINKDGSKSYNYMDLGNDLVAEIKDLNPDWEWDVEVQTYKPMPWSKERVYYTPEVIEHLLATASDFRDQSQLSFVKELPFYESADIRGAQYLMGRPDGTAELISEFRVAHLRENVRVEQARINMTSLSAMTGLLGVIPAGAQIFGADAETVYNISVVTQNLEGLLPAGRGRKGGARTYGRAGTILSYGDVERMARNTYTLARPNYSLTDKPNRAGLMGRTPDKYSATGRRVVDRMRADGDIIGEGPLLPGNPYGLKLKNADGTVSVIGPNVDMAHRTDAVTWWNSSGRYTGPKSQTVRDFMLDSNNYSLQLGSINRREGAILGKTTNYMKPAPAVVIGNNPPIYLPAPPPSPRPNSSLYGPPRQ